MSRIYRIPAHRPLRRNLPKGEFVLAPNGRVYVLTAPFKSGSLTMDVVCPDGREGWIPSDRVKVAPKAR